MRELIDKNDAILAMMKEQMNDIKEYGCPIPECFDGDRAINVLMNLPTIMEDPDISEYLDRIWKLAYERGKNEGIVRCKDCTYYDWTWVDKLEKNNNHYCPIIDSVTDIDFFCAKGERRLEDGKE